VHGRHSPDSPLGGRGDERATGVAVPPGAEGRPGDQDVRCVFLEIGKQLLERGIFVLGEVVVPAGERGDDLDTRELGRQPTPRPDRPLEPRRRRLRLVFAAKAGEELVQVVDGPHQDRAPSASWPI
jgi:hypothetical protein